MKHFRSIVTISLGLSLSCLAADDGKHAAYNATSPMAVLIAEKSGAEFEAAYLAMMILHHQSGVKMARIGAENATDKILKAMMKKASAQQTNEIEQMTEWLKEWHKKSPTDFEEPKESKQKMEKDMAELQAAKGKDFDKVFSAKMAEHHKGAVEMGHLAHSKAQHEEVKESGAQMAESQAKERKELLAIAGR